MRRPVLQLALLTVSSSLCLGGGEFVIRGYLDWDYQCEVEKFAADETYKIVDDRRYYLPKETGPKRTREVMGKCRDKGKVTKVWYDHINKNNLRGELVDISTLPANTRRVLFIGDSYTYGDCVAGNAVFHQCIERSLRASGIDVKCINAGVPGYNSEQELALLRKIYDQYQPDVVVLGYGMNDAQAIVKVPRPPSYTYGHVDSVVFEESKPLLNWLGRILVRDEGLFRKVKLDDDSNNYRRSFEKDSIAWRLSKNALAKMAQFCSEKNSEFRVVVIPDFTEPFDSRYGCSYIHEAVAEWGKQDGYFVQDLLPRFHNQNSATLRVKYDGHPNELAHQHMADMMLPGIRSALYMRDSEEVR